MTHAPDSSLTAAAPQDTDGHACVAGDDCPPISAAFEPPYRLRSIGTNRRTGRRLTERIISSYNSLIIRAYCRIRFLIMRIRFLEELDQYIPLTGRVLDLGCGFGLFSLYFASSGPRRSLTGVELSAGRIAEATQAAGKLELKNVDYTVGNALEHPLPDGLACAYMLDLLHHLPKKSVRPLLSRLHDALADDGIMLVKDVDTRPFYKRWFTLWLDRMMVGMEPIHYWSAEAMIAMLEDAGFTVHTHEMRDILPYPHRLYICRKK